MSCFVIIRGPAGVGKSVVSEITAKKIKAKVIHFDDVVDKLGLDYVSGDKWIPLYKFLKADKIMIPKFKEELELGRNIILDGNFYHKEQIENLTESLGFPYFVFTLKADLRECIERDKTRSNALGERAIKDVYKLVSVFDCGYVVETSRKTPVDVADEVFSYLPGLD